MIQCLPVKSYCQRNAPFVLHHTYEPSYRSKKYVITIVLNVFKDHTTFCICVAPFTRFVLSHQVYLFLTHFGVKCLLG